MARREDPKGKQIADDAGPDLDELDRLKAELLRHLAEIEERNRNAEQNAPRDADRSSSSPGVLEERQAGLRSMSPECDRLLNEAVAVAAEVAVPASARAPLSQNAPPEDSGEDPLSLIGHRIREFEEMTEEFNQFISSLEVVRCDSPGFATCTGVPPPFKYYLSRTYIRNLQRSGPSRFLPRVPSSPRTVNYAFNTLYHEPTASNSDPMCATLTPSRRRSMGEITGDSSAAAASAQSSEKAQTTRSSPQLVPGFGACHALRVELERRREEQRIQKAERDRIQDQRAMAAYQGVIHSISRMADVTPQQMTEEANLNFIKTQMGEESPELSSEEEEETAEEGDEEEHGAAEASNQ